MVDQGICVSEPLVAFTRLVSMMLPNQLLLSDTPFLCRTFTERLMSVPAHDVVELVGGPLDGRVFKEQGEKFRHDPHQLYVIGGHEYRPLKVETGKVVVLKMQHVGVHQEPA